MLKYEELNIQDMNFFDVAMVAIPMNDENALDDIYKIRRLSYSVKGINEQYTKLICENPLWLKVTEVRKKVFFIFKNYNDKCNSAHLKLEFQGSFFNNAVIVIEN